MSSLSDAVQGARHTPQTITWTGQNLTGATLTATKRNVDTGAVTTVDGVFTITDAVNGVFTWAYGAGDVGTAGQYGVQIRATYTLFDATIELSWIVHPLQSATTVPALPLVGVSPDDAAWVAAGSAGGALGELAYIDDADSDGKQYARQDGAWEEIEAAADVADLTTTGLTATNMLRVAAAGGLEARAPAQVLSDIGAEPALGNPGTTGHVLSSTTGGTRSWIAQAAGGAGDFLADGSVPMTNTLKLKGIGDGQNSTVFQIPVTSADGANINFVANSVLFAPTYDTTFNWGFNNGGAGPASAAKHSWYLQMEYDYYTGQHYVEYHLNLFGAAGAYDFRPFEYKYNIDGSTGSMIYRGSVYQWKAIAGASPHTILAITAEATALLSNFYVVSRSRFDIPDDASTGFYVLSQNGNVPIIALDTNNNDLAFRSRLLSFAAADGTNRLVVDTLGRWLLNGETYNAAALNILAPNNGRGLYLRTAGTNPKPHVLMAANDGTVEFGINNGGAIWTNQPTANTATPSGVTAYQLPIYGISGTLLGYIPVYAAAWS